MTVEETRIVTKRLHARPDDSFVLLSPRPDRPSP